MFTRRDLMFTGLTTGLLAPWLTALAAVGVSAATFPPGHTPNHVARRHRPAGRDQCSSELRLHRRPCGDRERAAPPRGFG